MSCALQRFLCILGAHQTFGQLVLPLDLQIDQAVHKDEGKVGLVPSATEVAVRRNVCAAMEGPQPPDGRTCNVLVTALCGKIVGHFWPQHIDRCQDVVDFICNHIVRECPKHGESDAVSVKEESNVSLHATEEAVQQDALATVEGSACNTVVESVCGVMLHKYKPSADKGGCKKVVDALCNRIVDDCPGHTANDVAVVKKEEKVVPIATVIAVQEYVCMAAEGLQPQEGSMCNNAVGLICEKVQHNLKESCKRLADAVCPQIVLGCPTQKTSDSHVVQGESKAEVLPTETFKAVQQYLCEAVEGPQIPDSMTCDTVVEAFCGTILHIFKPSADMEFCRQMVKIVCSRIVGDCPKHPEIAMFV